MGCFLEIMKQKNRGNNSKVTIEPRTVFDNQTLMYIRLCGERNDCFNNI